MKTDTEKTNNRPGSLWHGMLALLLMAGLSGTAKGGTLYSEAFYSFNNTNLSTVGWKGLLGSASNAVDYSTTNPVSPGLGVQGPNGDNTRGFVIGYITQTLPYALIYTEEFSFSTADYTDLKFSWKQANNTTVTTFHVAIKLNGSWYVSSTGLSMNTSAGGYGGMEAKEYQFTNAANSWYSLSFALGSTLALGNLVETELPTGTITGFGLYAQRNGSGATLRLDDFAITGTAIPEPATMALVLGVGVGLVVLFRRRR
ncbi:PEP-CTERM sorting domain-containing protein [Geminisphaera colitermitum]|uniref:PEP-CTERM sorting domain-containing protein n=1 Tax=Geminisphaera colitermitum TaxID=1148786 RepID=UPI000158D4E0|nr:PEP-CTERM sorting domain-containing protein [Geminisphaera colitermitum]